MNSALFDKLLRLIDHFLFVMQFYQLTICTVFVYDKFSILLHLKYLCNPKNKA